MSIHDEDYERDQDDYVEDALSHAGTWTEEDERASSGGALTAGQNAGATRPYLSTPEGGEGRG